MPSMVGTWASMSSWWIRLNHAGRSWIGIGMPALIMSSW